MPDEKVKLIEQHIKTHSQHSDEDRAAVGILEIFLRSKGKINTNFSSNDKWPNSDGTFEFVSNPEISRRPEQNFIVQIKGTHRYIEKDGMIKYSLKSLAFPALICRGMTLDPGILFVVLNPDRRGEERVFWKYMSIEFINSIDYRKNSVTIDFMPEDEIKNSDESVDGFCAKLSEVINHHSFVSQLENREYNKKDIVKIINECDRQITESIDRMKIYNDTRDDVSKRVLKRLDDLCVAVLLLNALKTDEEKMNLRLAWEKSFLDINTKYLGTFYKSIRYIGYRIPDDGQSERLMLKYYNFLWKIRKFLKENYGLIVLCNLEKFPLSINDLDQEYYELIAKTIKSIDLMPDLPRTTRFYVQKKTPFYIGTERYFEITLQLAGVYATKYNRITAYTKEDISTNYSVQIGYTDVLINLWGIETKVKVITNWKVSIDPYCLNKLGKILHIPMRLNARHGEYIALMYFLTKTGINFLELIDLQEVEFEMIVNSIYKNTNTADFKEALLKLKNNYSEKSEKFGRHVIRYLLLNLKEETIESVLPNRYNPKCLCDELYLSKKCFPFENNPFISNLAGSRTSEESRVKSIANIVSREEINVVYPYLNLRNKIKQTGEIYFEAESIASKEKIDAYNTYLDSWERAQGYKIKQEKGYVCIDLFEKNTIHILKKLLTISQIGNKGQREYNQKFVRQGTMDVFDVLKVQAIKEAFVNSQLLLIYGAAGTGKTTLVNCISNLMTGKRKLFLTKTHTALQNLKRRIENPGTESEFVSIDSFTKKISLSEYDIIFVDECSTIDNRTMWEFLQKMNPGTFLVLAGDIYQIESIDFGNWFFYAKEIIKTQGANAELLNTWRTEDETLISLWNEVRTKGSLITEKLAIDGPFSENIGSNILNRRDKDEVVLCLNYDGKFGLNNMNNYFQNANKKGELVSWQEWNYKVGDPILFNDTRRFSVLYNNLKGKIVEIEKTENSITFTVDVDTILTEKDCSKEDLEFIDIVGDSTRIRFSVYAYDSNVTEENMELMRMNSVIPFQLAYAVSIHKAQGLEYKSVKVVIPNSNSEKITHGIFYTAITRAKEKLKIYWSSETMHEIVGNFSIEESECKSLDIVREKLLYEK